MTCAGEGGGPTVLLESGYHESSDTWMVAENDSDRSVFDRLADRYRVCAYDRAGTLLLLDEAQSVTDRTTPVPMPRTAADVVEDLHAGFEGSGESGRSFSPPTPSVASSRACTPRRIPRT